MRNILVISHNTPENAVKTLAYFILLALCTQIRIPIHPVPITLQTVAVLLIGFLGTPIQAFTGSLLYIIGLGLGLPIHSGFQAAPGILYGATAGYLLSFPISSAVISMVVNYATLTYYPRAIAATALGTIVTLFTGVAWLSMNTGIIPAIKLGLLPFIIPGIIKAFILIALLRLIDKQNPENI